MTSPALPVSWAVGSGMASAYRFAAMTAAMVASRRIVFIVFLSFALPLPINFPFVYKPAVQGALPSVQNAIRRQVCSDDGISCRFINRKTRHVSSIVPGLFFSGCVLFVV